MKIFAYTSSDIYGILKYIVKIRWNYPMQYFVNLYSNMKLASFRWEYFEIDESVHEEVYLE